MKSIIFGLLLVLAITGFSCATTAGKVICNRFDLITKVALRSIVFHLETDLPEDTTIMVTVSRNYWSKNNETLVIAYFEERTSVGDLHKPMVVGIDDSEWTGKLERKQKFLASLGETLQVSRISDQVVVSLTVPVSQKNAAFGYRNENLESPLASIAGRLRIIETEKSFHMPFGSTTLATSADYSYEIIKAERTGTIKSDITVRLNRKISQEELRNVAMALREKEPRDTARVFITYWLPGMEVGKTAAWATTHFDPDLNVFVIGMTLEQEKKLLKDKESVSGKVIGVWLSDMYGKYTIYEEGSNYAIKIEYFDGSSGTNRLEKYKLRGEVAFRETDNGHGEYYLIGESGGLGLYDTMGLITAMRRIK